MIQRDSSHVRRTAPAGRWRAGLFVALIAASIAPIASVAHAEDQGGNYVTTTTPTPTTIAPDVPSNVSGDDDDGNYVTTTTPERSLDVSAFSPACIRDAPYMRYAIVPVGFDPTGSATLVVKDRNGTVLETLQVSSLTGTVIYPGASVDADGDATDWPGWKRADDGSWIPDPTDTFVREGLIIEATLDGTTATATVSYPANSSGCANPDEQALDVSGFSPVCIAGAPFVQYDIETINFSSTGPVTLTFLDKRGGLVEERVVNNLSGRTIYPGASVDDNGSPTDWPGWTRAANGSWIPDATDAGLRDGLTIQVEVGDATATATVAYVATDAPCHSPDNACQPGQDGDSTPANDCTPCVPGQNNDNSPADDCTLPRTGGGPSRLLNLAAIAVIAGLALVLLARRKRTDPTPS